MKLAVIGVLLALTVISIAIALSSPEVFQKEEFLRVKNVEYSIQSINESHVVLNFTFSFERKGLENFTITSKIFDSQTGVLLKKKKLTIPKLNEVSIPLVFRKDRSYTVVFEGESGDGRSRFVKEFHISGLNSLVPEERKLLMEIEDTDFMVKGERDGKVSIRMRFYVHSMENYSDVLFHIKAIQLESNLLANESYLRAEIETGKTLMLETDMDVPENYNYLVKVEAWRDEMLLKRWDFPLKLSPTEIIPEKVREKKVKLNISEFVKRYPESYPSEIPTPKPMTRAPGFETIVAFSAFITALGLWHRRYS